MVIIVNFFCQPISDKMERRWEEEQNDNGGEDTEEEDDVDWRMPSALGSPSIKTPSMLIQPSSSSGKLKNHN